MAAGGERAGPEPERRLDGGRAVDSRLPALGLHHAELKKLADQGGADFAAVGSEN